MMPPFERIARDCEMSCGLRAANGRACSMPEDEALISELTSPTYSFTSTGKMVVESKADMKKRGLRSPDLADAFLLNFGSKCWAMRSS